MESRFKIFSDPVHGFISVPKDELMPLIQTPEVQRLRRIRQLGVGHLVFPGAEHTRFAHALGAMALMQDALAVLTEKGTPVSPEEHSAALAVALLHDIGHGPFSHTLEHELIGNFRHELMSRTLLTVLNERFGGSLDLALALFDGTYERPFFSQLLASQLDMDRLDYLRRDSFHTGVVEGRVGVERIIKTLRVHPTDGGPDSRVVIEEKGIYAVENFILSRQLMYWQVYLHKTVLAGDHLLRSILLRVRAQIDRGRSHVVQAGSPDLLFFLERRLDRSALDEPDTLHHFCALDDTDLFYSLKQWAQAPDPVLADLCRRFVERAFFRVRFLEEPPPATRLAVWYEQIGTWLTKQGLSPAEAEAVTPLYLTQGRTHLRGYQDTHEQAIAVVDRQGRLRELSRTTDTPAISAVSSRVVKPYICFPKEVELVSGEQ